MKFRAVWDYAPAMAIEIQPGDGIVRFGSLHLQYSSLANRRGKAEGGKVSEDKKSVHILNCLPECMRPDGGEACKGFLNAERRIGELQAKVDELKAAIVFTESRNVEVARMLSSFTKPDTDNYLLAGIVVNMALPKLREIGAQHETND